MAKLKDLESKFDRSYEYSDDYSFWSQQNEIKKRIDNIKQKLKGQAVAVARSLSIINR